ncbi:MAG TPA: aminotransferase class I/II-fold pyridoxal phosphate-dependent enzyme [Bryobacteraceae bacterium]
MEQTYVAEAFATNWLSTVGPNVTAFEEEFAHHIGMHSVALSSGTAAMHLALRLLGVEPDDEVFCPTLTFVATANPIVYMGAKPVFLDSDRESWNLDPDLLARALKQRADRNQLPKAVIVVHLYGQPADMDPILEACDRYEVPLLEDAAEALGATYKGKPVGQHSGLAVYSFNGNKMITTTGGGMLSACDPDWIRRARYWSTQARDNAIWYEHTEMGYNYRMSNVLAGIGRGQLQVLPTRVEQRRAIAFRYRDAFADIPGLTFMPQSPHGVVTNWLSCFLVDSMKLALSRDELIAALDADDIETRPVWKPMHLQPLYRHAESIGGEIAADLFNRGICLPSSSSLSIEDQTRVIESVRQAAGVPSA